MRKATTQKGETKILRKAATLIEKSQFEKAMNTLRDGVSRYPRSKAIWEQIVACNLALKKPKEALRALEYILQIDPQYAQAWTDKAYLHLLLNEKYKGIVALQKSLQLDPRNQRKWLLLGTAYMSGEEWDRAIEALERAILLNPNSATAWYNFAICHFFTDNFVSAIAAAEQAFTIEPELEEIAQEWIAVAKSYLLGSFEDALEFEVAS